MTYGENKKIFLSLVDEYAPNLSEFTEDEDIITKCAQLYANAYQDLADVYTKPKTRDIDIVKTTGNIGYEEYSLPKCKQVRRVIARDQNNNMTEADYYYLGNKIYISNKETLKYTIEYIPYLSLINDETPDDFELEIEQDLQGLLPWSVASSLFMTDPGENYSAFQNEYQRRLSNLNTSRKGVSAKIIEGEL